MVASDGSQVRIGKRKQWLAPNAVFFGWQLLRVELERAAHAAHAALGGGGVVRLYGELFGGHYPHPSVPPMPGASAVQTGIWYCPDVRFSLFDVLVEHANALVFLAHDEVNSFAVENALASVPVLARGTRQVCEQVPVRFETRVPSCLGLPPLAGNYAEGFVLKPNARATRSERFALKKKIPEFDEGVFDESHSWNADARLDAAALHALASRLVNSARVASAPSKIGDGDHAALRDEIALDVLVDLESAFPSAMRALSPAEEEALRTQVEALARAVLALNVDTDFVLELLSHRGTVHGSPVAPSYAVTGAPL